jgi:hypothetical protein
VDERQRGFTPVVEEKKGPEEVQGEFGGLQPDPVDRESALKWIRQKWGDDKPCPYCGGIEWGVAAPRRFQTVEGQTEPMFAVVCRNCGNTVLIDSRFPELRRE